MAHQKKQDSSLSVARGVPVGALLARRFDEGGIFSEGFEKKILFGSLDNRSHTVI